MATISLSCLSVILIVSLMTGGILSSIEELTESNNKLFLDMYQILRNTSGNILVSPISLHMILAMALEGAAGTTADEIKKVLHLGNESEQLLEGYQTLITGLENSPIFNVASAMFVEETLMISPSFNSTLTQRFGSGIKKTNFMEDPESSRKEINLWVMNKTKQKIKNLLPIDAVDSSTNLVLVNGVAFKADWKIKFDKKNTIEQAFYVHPETTTNVHMMSISSSRFPYFWDNELKAQIIEIPYTDEGYRMIIILPDELDGLTALESKLATFNITDTLSKLIEYSVDIELPKFKLRKKLDMTRILVKMGMPTAFTSRADFSRISNSSVLISSFVQKSAIIVNEHGTEAVSASGASIMSKSFPNQIKCDHPFMFLIMKKNLILFAGRFSKPNST